MPQHIWARIIVVLAAIGLLLGFVLLVAHYSPGAPPAGAPGQYEF